MRRRSYLTLMASTGLAVTGCLGSEESASKEDVAETVLVRRDGFDPRTISIDVGEGVEWENQDSETHTVVARKYHADATEWEFEAKLKAEESDFFVFDAEGIYDYVCRIHTDLYECGSVFVGDVDETEEHLPCG